MISLSIQPRHAAVASIARGSRPSGQRGGHSSPQRSAHRSARRGSRPRAQRGSTLILVIIALSVLLISAVVILRSSGVATEVAGNIAFRTAANQAAEVAINTAVTTIQTAVSNGTFNGDTGAGLPSGSYFALMQTTDSAGIPQVSAWPSATQSGQFQLQWIVDRLCRSTPVTDPTSQCRTAQGSQSGNSVAAGSIQFPTPPRVFYRITAMVTGPKGAVSYVQALVEL